MIDRPEAAVPFDPSLQPLPPGFYSQFMAKWSGRVD